jgi:hypothetical protein
MLEGIFHSEIALPKSPCDLPYSVEGHMKLNALFMNEIPPGVFSSGRLWAQEQVSCALLLHVMTTEGSQNLHRLSLNSIAMAGPRA